MGLVVVFISAFMCVIHVCVCTACCSVRECVLGGVWGMCAYVYACMFSLMSVCVCRCTLLQMLRMLLQVHNQFSYRNVNHSKERLS